MKLLSPEKFSNLRLFVSEKTYVDQMTDNRKSINPLHEDSIKIIDDYATSTEEGDLVGAMVFDLEGVPGKSQCMGKAEESMNEEEV